MRFKGALSAALGMVAVTAAAAIAQSDVAQAEHHVRKACEAVWAPTKPYQIERCTRRAMAALAEENRLRDNELKRLLVDSERELETCRHELDEVRDELTRQEASDAHKSTNPSSPGSGVGSQP